MTTRLCFISVAGDSNTCSACTQAPGCCFSEELLVMMFYHIIGTDSLCYFFQATNHQPSLLSHICPYGRFANTDNTILECSTNNCSSSNGANHAQFQGKVRKNMLRITHNIGKKFTPTVLNIHPCFSVILSVIGDFLRSSGTMGEEKELYHMPDISTLGCSNLIG